MGKQNILCSLGCEVDGDAHVDANLGSGKNTFDKIAGLLLCYKNSPSTKLSFYYPYIQGGRAYFLSSYDVYHPINEVNKLSTGSTTDYIFEVIL